VIESGENPVILSRHLLLDRAEGMGHNDRRVLGALLDAVRLGQVADDCVALVLEGDTFQDLSLSGLCVCPGRAWPRSCAAGVRGGR